MVRYFLPFLLFEPNFGPNVHESTPYLIAYLPPSHKSKPAFCSAYSAIGLVTFTTLHTSLACISVSVMTFGSTMTR